MLKSDWKILSQILEAFLIMSPTGHFHIKKAIKKNNALLGGEMSGHIFFNDKWYGFDDGHYAAARATEILARSDKSISELFEEFPLIIFNA